MTAKHFDTYRYDGLWLEVHMGVWSPKVAADLQAYLTTNIAWRQGETALVRKDGTPSIRRVSQLYGEPLRAPIYTVRYQGQVRGEHSALCALVSPFHPTIICNGMPVTAPILVREKSKRTSRVLRSTQRVQTHAYDCLRFYFLLPPHSRCRIGRSCHGQICRD
jgi:hypothetical protein